MTFFVIDYYFQIVRFPGYYTLLQRWTGAGHILTAWMVGQMSYHCPDLSHHWNVSHHRYYVVVLAEIYKKTGFLYFLKYNRLG